MASLRKKIALVILAFGLFGAAVYVPFSTCHRLGWRGSWMEDSYCEFKGYRFTWDRPASPRTKNSQVRVDHFRMVIEIVILVIIAILIGLDYKFLNRFLSG